MLLELELEPELELELPPPMGVTFRVPYTRVSMMMMIIMMMPLKNSELDAVEIYRQSLAWDPQPLALQPISTTSV